MRQVKGFPLLPQALDLRGARLLLKGKDESEEFQLWISSESELKTFVLRRAELGKLQSTSGITHNDSDLREPA